MNVIDYENTLKNVEELVRQASKKVKLRNFTVEGKLTKEDIVTSADLDVQEFLCDRLQKLLPHSGFLCEEKGFLDLRHDYVWVIDPIDGTMNYSRGINECVISVALLHCGNPIIGIVYAPFVDFMFTAIAGGGAELNGEPIRTSDKSFGESLFCTAMSLYKKEYAKICIDIIFDVYRECNDVRRFGSCAMELCYIAAGKCDLYFEIRVFPWDYAAAYLILKEAGGILKGLNGEEVSFDKPTVLVGANNFENYKKLDGIINKYLKTTPYNEEL